MSNRKYIPFALLLALIIVVDQFFFLVIFPKIISRNLQSSIESRIKISSQSANLAPVENMSPSPEQSAIIPASNFSSSKNIEILYDISKFNIETTNNLFSSLINATVLILTILIVIGGFIVYFAIDKAKEVNKLMDEAKQKAEQLNKQKEEQETEQNKPADIASTEINALNKQLKTTSQRATELENLHKQDEQTKNTLLLKLHFENVYHLIFQSQTDILQIINNQTENKLSKAILEAIHRRTVWIKTYAFENYIGFLVNNKLYKRNEISKKGKRRHTCITLVFGYNKIN